MGVRCTAAPIGSARAQPDATPLLPPIDRLFWVFLSWWWPGWREALTIIQLETVLRWRRHGISTIWKYRSRGRWRGGRPRIAAETRHLIVDMARANFLWGAPRIHGELLKLGITVSQAAVSRYIPVAHGGRRSQRWRTFVRNHAAAIVCSRSFEGHSWVDDLRLQLLPWPHAFKRHAAEVFFTAALAGPLCSTAWHLVDSHLLAAARLRVRFAAGAALTASSTALACRCTPPALLSRSFGDRSNPRPTASGRHRTTIPNADQ